jgi:hypothetical protein
MLRLARMCAAACADVTAAPQALSSRRVAREPSFTGHVITTLAAEATHARLIARDAARRTADDDVTRWVRHRATLALFATVHS